ncbi:hypothetical protein [Paenibacillus sp. Mc5Re-14]|uniref:hypothetical protein n=1 Tax=Paenibacillus sp. Mc5Re-14 TaxID=1030529 RepID=UPI00159EE7A4|nr:hypothetical protein [Paenibacillus sp. Mc5Re-14]
MKPPNKPSGRIMRSNSTEIAKAGGSVAEISKLDMILIDFDGTISPNAVAS